MKNIIFKIAFLISFLNFVNAHPLSNTDKFQVHNYFELAGGFYKYNEPKLMHTEASELESAYRFLMHFSNGFIADIGILLGTHFGEYHGGLIQNKKEDPKINFSSGFDFDLYGDLDINIGSNINVDKLNIQSKIGIGERNLLNYMIGGYPRYQEYIYIPLSLSIFYEFKNFYLGLKGKYKHVIFAHNETDLRAMGYELLKIWKQKGFGYEISSIFVLKNGKTKDGIGNISIEIGYKNWDITDSEIVKMSHKDKDKEGYGIEPANQTHQIQLKLGIAF